MRRQTDLCRLSLTAHATDRASLFAAFSAVASGFCFWTIRGKIGRVCDRNVFFCALWNDGLEPLLVPRGWCFVWCAGGGWVCLTLTWAKGDVRWIKQQTIQHLPLHASVPGVPVQERGIYFKWAPVLPFMFQVLHSCRATRGDVVMFSCETRTHRDKSEQREKSLWLPTLNMRFIDVCLLAST